MESVLKQLEARIEELVGAYRTAVDRTAELESRIAELESERDELADTLANQSDTGERIAELETQRDQLATRLEKVLGVVDRALESADTTD